MERFAKASSVNTLVSKSDLLSFLSDYGIAYPSLSRIKSGRNSRVWKIYSGQRLWLLKQYHHHTDDPRDRLSTEFSFLSFLHENEVQNIPKPLVSDRERRCGLYSYLPGEAVKTITKEHIKQIVNFVCGINQLRTKTAAQHLPYASEASLSLVEHLKQIFNRLERLKKIEEDGSVYETAKNLVKEKLIPAFLHMRDSIMSQYSQNMVERLLEPDERILSPSDLGFHNILQERDRLNFLDFEYAGWDDPAKLFCDFACQPERPVTRPMAEVFWEQVCRQLNLSGAEWRAEILLPLYRIKWCCILMNEFCKKDRERREYAGRQQGVLLSVQLGKAQDYFNQHLRDI
jgi:thiamine kinase-like enzyme